LPPKNFTTLAEKKKKKFNFAENPMKCADADFIVDWSAPNNFLTPEI